MKKTKNTMMIIVFVAVILVLNLIFICSRLGARQGYARNREADLEGAFLSAFGEGLFFEKTEYQDIVHKKEGNIIVYMGKSSGGSVGNYVVFRKSLLFDRWWTITKGSMMYDTDPVLIDAPMVGRIYLSLNAGNIAQAEIVKDGRTTMVDIDPDRPLIVITDHKMDSITFFTERDREITETDFLKNGF